MKSTSLVRPRIVVYNYSNCRCHLVPTTPCNGSRFG